MKNVGVIFGSRSTEHDVSIVTAISTVINPLNLSNKFHPVPVYITKDGSWYSHRDLGKIDFYTSGNVEQKLKKYKKQQILFDDGFFLITPGVKSKKVKLDIVFPALHGTYGEDGSIMGLLRMAGVPFVGADMGASVVAMDKLYAKDIAVAGGCPSNKYIGFTASDYKKDSAKLLTKLKKMSFPLFVKPTHMGSSIGISKIEKLDELENAIEVAFHYDDKVIVEEAVPNLIEVTLPIMGNDELQPALLEQAILGDKGVFDFDTKYLRGGKKGGKGGAKSAGEQSSQGYSILPADLDESTYDAAVDVALRAYRATGCQGFARIDLLIDSKANKIYFNEINPMPGSLYAHNWKKAGVSNVALVEKLIALAEERYGSQQKNNTVFDTNFLSQF